MTLTFHALWMLCALSAVVFAACAASSASALAALAAGFGAAALLTGASAVPDAVWTGGIAAIAATAYLFKPRLRLVSLFIGGALAGIFATLLEVQGSPALVALPLAGALVVMTIRLSQSRPWFAPDVLKEEGLLGVGVIGLVVAIMPGILDGWQAATNLSGTPERAAEPTAIPMWTLALILTSSSLGALYSLWSRR